MDGRKERKGLELMDAWRRKVWCLDKDSVDGPTWHMERNPTRKSCDLSRRRWDMSMTCLGRSHHPCSYYRDGDLAQLPHWWYDPYIWVWWWGYWCYEVDAVLHHGCLSGFYSWICCWCSFNLQLIKTACLSNVNFTALNKENCILPVSSSQIILDWPEEMWHFSWLEANQLNVMPIQYPAKVVEDGLI
jgi:hypothetical protein